MTGNELRQSRGTEPRFFYGYIVVALALLIMFLAYGTRTTFGIFFKPMLTEFDWTRALTSGAFTLSMITQGILGIFMGRYNDRIGPRLVMTLCCFFLGLGFLLLSQTGSAWHLYLFYGVVIGIGMGGVLVVLLSTAARWFVKRRGTMTGIVSAGMGVGTLIMAPVSNWLISVYDWRLSYVIVGSGILVIGIVAAQFLRRDPSQMGLVPYGQEGGEPGLAPGAEGLSLKEAAGTRQFWMAAIIFFCLGYHVFSISVHLVPHVTDLGISAATAANILAMSGVLRIISFIVWGGVADRIGNRRVLAISFVLIAVSMFWLVAIKEVWMFYLFVVVAGFGSGGAGLVESTVVAELFGMKSHGVILGAISFVFTIGAALGPFVTGYVFDVNGTYQVAFLVCAIVSVIGLILSAVLRPTKRLEIKL